MSAEWAVIRQVVLGVPDVDTAASALCADLGLARGFPDPLLEDIGMGDETVRVGPEAHIEVVGSLRHDTSIARWLAKAGGRSGGYALSIQVPAVRPLLERAQGLGIGIAADLEAYGNRIVQMQPQAMGLLVELDEIPERGRWFWDDIPVVTPPDPRVDDVLAVELSSPDPIGQHTKWVEFFGPAVEAIGLNSLTLGGRQIRFVRGDRTHLSGVDLHGVGDSVMGHVTVGDVTLRIC